MKTPPLFSIVIVTWNSAKHLPRCLNSLRAQTIQDFEIILVDNGSTDGSADGVQGKYSDLRIKVNTLEKNLGFAAANNIGARLARGKWLVLLNADAFPEPDWLQKLLHAAEQHPDYNFFASRQIQYLNPKLLDGAGDEYHTSGLAWRRYYNHSSTDHGLTQQEIFGACAAAAMYRREDFLNTGELDEDFFSYFEDVDLSFRLRLRGGRCLYVPEAVVHHVGSASTGKLSDFVIYYGHRNLVWTFVKNMPGILFWLYLPFHLAMNAFFLIYFSFRGKAHAIFRAKRDALLNIRQAFMKRRLVQSTRTVTSQTIHRFMCKGILDPYHALRQRKKGKHSTQ